MWEVNELSEWLGGCCDYGWQFKPTHKNDAPSQSSSFCAEAFRFIVLTLALALLILPYLKVL